MRTDSNDIRKSGDGYEVEEIKRPFHFVAIETDQEENGAKKREAQQHNNKRRGRRRKNTRPIGVLTPTNDLILNGTRLFSSEDTICRLISTWPTFRSSKFLKIIVNMNIIVHRASLSL